MVTVARESQNAHNLRHTSPSCHLGRVVGMPEAGAGAALSHSVTFQSSSAVEASKVFADLLLRLDVAQGQAIQVTPSAWVASVADGLFTVSPHFDPLRRRDDEYVATLSLRSPNDELLARVDRLPFTATEMANFGNDMPVTSSFPRVARVTPDAQPFAGLVGIFTIHHQTDFLVLIDVARELGIRLQDSLVVDKEYRYANTARVDETIRARFGCQVTPYSDVETGIRAFLDGCRSRRDRAIVFDDGGYVYPVISELVENDRVLHNYVIGIVEQTQSGIWKIDAFAKSRSQEIRLPIFSVAESDLKATVESHGVAASGFRALRNLLPQEKFTGRRAIVSGYGRIGAALAEVLRRERLSVAVYDPRMDRLVAAHEAGFTTNKDLQTLVREFRPQFFFGCAGKDGAVSTETFEEFAVNCKLVSTTSRDFEFDKTALAELATVKRRTRAGTIYEMTTSGVELTLVADGFPSNFYYAESMPNRHSDLIMASLLLGGVSLVADRYDVGHNVQRSNDALNQSNLLEVYYDSHS